MVEKYAAKLPNELVAREVASYPWETSQGLV